MADTSASGSEDLQLHRCPPGDGHDIIVIGASAGGVEALTTLVRRLPRDLMAAVFVVLHMAPQAPSALPRILSHAGSLPAIAARDGEPIHCGRIYVGVPDYHLLLEDGQVRVVRGPRENRTRPAIDPLFRTAARWYGARVVGVVLSGALDDGSAGLYAIKRQGGVAVVQDPKDAIVASMPQSAIAYVAVDYTLPAAQIPRVLVHLAHTPAPSQGAIPVPEGMKLESELAAMNSAAVRVGKPTGSPSKFTCPDCHGPLWEIKDGELLRFRCSSGHAYTAETLVMGQTEAVEEALWAALTTLREAAEVVERLAKDARERHNTLFAERLERRALERRRHVEALRELLVNSGHSDYLDPAGIVE